MLSKNRLWSACGALALAVAALTPAGMAQDDYGVTMDELVMRYYTPERVKQTDLVEVAQQLFGRNQYVDRGPDAQGDSDYVIVERFLYLDDTIIVRDTASKAERIMAKLAEMEEAIRPAAKGAGAGASSKSALPFETLRYKPRNLSVDEVYDAVQPYHRMFTLPSGPGGIEATRTTNISVFEERQMLLIRETPEMLVEIRAHLESIDVPVPQATFTLYLVRGTDDAAEAEGGLTLPGEVVEELKRMLPHSNYQTVASGVIRSAASAKVSMDTLGISEGRTWRYGLSMAPAAFDAATGTLTVKQLGFSRWRQVEDSWLDDQSFNTALTLRAGEYTVIGSVGSAPTLVVLHMEL